MNGRTAAFAVFTAVVISWLPHAGAQLALRVGYSANSGNYTGLWMAKEARWFDREGVKVDVVYIPSGTLLAQALLSDEVHVGFSNGGQMVAAVAQGADLSIIGIALDRMVFSLMASSKIGSVTDLKGKRVGVTRFGSATDVSGRFAVKKYGLEPDRDVVFIQMGEISAILAGIQSGVLDAGILSPPTHWAAEKAGLKELINITDLNIAYPNPAIGASRRNIKERSDALSRFVRAYVAALLEARKERAITKKVLAKYTRIHDDAIIDKLYDFFVGKLLDPVPRISKDALLGAVDEQARRLPKVKEMPLTAFYDDRFVRAAESLAK